MPNCHHCSTNVDAPITGNCSICAADAVPFCAICGWWEVGPPESDFGVGLTVAGLLNPEAVVLECLDKVPWMPLDQCGLMAEQCAALSTRAYEGESYQLFHGLTTWGEAMEKCLACIDHFFPVPDEQKRMRAMMTTYLSAFEICLTNQLQRMALDDRKSPLSLYDAPRFASKHYRAHQGFGVSGGLLELDCRTLDHLDTIEQFLKGELKVSLAAVLLRQSCDDAPAAQTMAGNAALLYLTLLTVMEPYESQAFKKAGFNAGQNGATGIFTRAHIQSCWDGSPDDRMVSAAVEERLAMLFTAIEHVPDFQGRYFRFNSLKNEQIIDGMPSLSNAQKLYLKSLPDLDAADCPSVCRINVWSAAETLLAKFITELNGEGVKEMAEYAVQVLQPKWRPILFDVKNAGPLLNTVMRVRTANRFTVQTSANDVAFLTRTPYVGLWELYEQKLVLGEVAPQCDVSVGVPFIGTKYRESDAKRASDRRTECPFEYVSWRMQKDRAAHQFLPMQPADYEVTAAICQSYPLPEPLLTYGKQMIVWKGDIGPRCTFKVRDSGKPRRSALQLLLDLLVASEKDAQSRNAVFNMLVQVIAGGVELDAFGQFTKKDLCFFPDIMLMGMLDIEVHIYGRVGMPNVAAILVPAGSSTVKTVLKQFAGFKTARVVAYDEETWMNNHGSPGKMELHQALARMQL